MKVCLVALKCDLREDPIARERVARYGDEMVEYEQVRFHSSAADYLEGRLSEIPKCTGFDGRETDTSLEVFR